MDKFEKIIRMLLRLKKSCIRSSIFNLRSSIHFILFMALVLCFGLAEASKLKIRVLPNPLVSSQKITLGDIAEISGGNTNEIQKIQSVFIANLPGKDKSRTISRDMVISVLKRNRIELEGADFISPETIEISRKMIMVRARDIEERARKYLEQNFREGTNEITITNLTYAGNDLFFPAGDLRIEFLPLNRVLKTGPVFIHAKVLVDERPLGNFKVKADVTVSREIAVSSNSIKKGQIITSADFEMEERSDKLGNRRLMTSPESLIGKKARRRISANQLIQENMVEQPPLINKKERVKIVLESEFLSISAVGIAQEDGLKDSYIKVMNIDSKKVIVARVIGAKIVKVDF